MLNEQWNVYLSRVLPYWLTVFAVCWTLAYFYMWNSDVAYERYDAKVSKVRASELLNLSAELNR